MKEEVLVDAGNYKVMRYTDEFDYQSEFNFQQMKNSYVSESITNKDIEYWDRQETIEDNYYKNIIWKPNLPVFISAQTGSGKNYFITHNLRLYAKEQGCNILYISNRVALDFQQKQELAKLTRVNLNRDEDSWTNTEIFDNVTVTTYQKLYKYFIIKEKEWFQKFKYIVFDECHFFYSDALFNINTGYILNKIKDFFCNSIRIYMSATFDDVLNPIFDEEILMLEKKIKDLYDQIEKEPDRSIKLPFLPSQLANFTFDKPYLPNAKSYFCWNVNAYEFPRNFSQYKCKFFSKINQIEKIIKETKSNDKWLIFLDDKKLCKKLCDSLNSHFSELRDNISSSKVATFIDSSSRNLTNNNRDSFLAWHQLKKDGKFDSLILITTSVLDNGFSIKDSKLKNIVICSDDKTEFLQELGRCRIDENTEINLYIKKMTNKSHSDRIKYHEKLADFFEEYDANQDNTNLIITNHWHDNNDSIRKLIKLVPDSNNRLIPLINFMARWRNQILKQQIDEYEQCLKNNGTKSEILYKASWLMSEADISKLDFSDIDLDSINDDKNFNSLIDFLKAEAEKAELLTKTEPPFKDFAKEFEKFFRLAFPNDTSLRGVNDRGTWQTTAIKNHLDIVNQKLTATNNNAKFEFIEIDKKQKTWQLNIKN